MIRSLLPLILLAAPAAAAGFQDIAGLDRAVSSFTGHGVGEDGGARTGIDRRLRLAQCPTVALSWRTSAQDAVVVACSGPNWRIFVPVQRAVPLPAAAPAPISGVSPVAAIANPLVRAPAVIKRGDPVVVEAGSNGFSISREGVAMADAPAGGRFLIRVDGAKSPVQAVAVEPGRATLPGWAE